MLDDEPLSSGPQTMRQSRRFSTALARTSAFPRTETHLLQQTVAGAALSVAGAALVLILLVCELRDFVRLSTELKARRQATQGGFAKSALTMHALYAARSGHFARSNGVAHGARHLLSVGALCRRAELPPAPSAAPELSVTAALSFDRGGAGLGWNAGERAAPEPGEGAHECWRHFLDAHALQTRLDSRGHVLGVYEPPPAQEDLYSFFGGRQAQARGAASLGAAGADLLHTHQLFLFGGYLQLTSPEAMKDMQDALTAQEGCQMLCKLPVARVAGAFHVSVHSLSFELVRQVRHRARDSMLQHADHGRDAATPGAAALEHES